MGIQDNAFIHYKLNSPHCMSVLFQRDWITNPNSLYLIVFDRIAKDIVECVEVPILEFGVRNQNIVSGKPYLEIVLKLLGT